MINGYQIVVCGSVVPDPLQTLEPVSTPTGPVLKNEAMLPAILDPWAAHALYEAADLASRVAGTKIWLVSLGPKPKLQQVMMTIAQRVSFEFIPVDSSASGFAASHATAVVLAETIQAQAPPCNWWGSGLGFSTSFKELTSSKFSPTVRSRFWKESKVGATRFQCARVRRLYSAGPQATCPSLVTILRLVWPICAR